MILTARNANVAHLNQMILNKLLGDARQYVSADSVINEQGVDDHMRGVIAPEVLRSIVGSGLPPGELNLKPGCPVILLHNLNPALGLCNGTWMVVTRMANRVIEGRILGGKRDGELVFIPRIAIIPSEAISNIIFTFKCRQFPLQLAFALSINKLQGQTVCHIGLDQYLALPRCPLEFQLTIGIPLDIHLPV